MSFEGRIDFLGIGAQKCGTTWLFENLKSHPDVWMPEEKELHFLDGGRGQNWTWPYRADINDSQAKLYLAATNSLNAVFEAKDFEPPEYLSYFDRADPHKVIGEITPAYALLHPLTIKRVRALNPQLKLLFSIKNPAIRAYGNALNRLQKRVETHITSENVGEYSEFLYATLTDVSNVAKSLYSHTITNWLSYFSRASLLVINFETIQSNPRDVLKQVAHHIGVDQDYFEILAESSLKRPINTSKISSKSAFESHPPPEAIARLLNYVYQPEVRRLEALLQTDLSHWRQEILSMPVSK